MKHIYAAIACVGLSLGLLGCSSDGSSGAVDEQDASVQEDAGGGPDGSPDASRNDAATRDASDGDARPDSWISSDASSDGPAPEDAVASDASEGGTAASDATVSDSALDGTPGDARDAGDGSALSDGRAPSDAANEGDGHTGPVPLDWSYTPYTSGVTGGACTTLASATLSHTDLQPFEAATLDFGCVIDANSVTVTVGGIAFKPVQVAPTQLGFLVPPNVASGAAKLSLSSSLGARQLDIVLAAAATIANPRLYVREFFESQRALVAQVRDPAAARKLTALLDDAAAQLSSASDQELRFAAQILAANEDKLGLEQKAVCQIEGSTPERWWACFTDVIEERLAWGAGFAVAAIVANSAATVTIWSGVPALAFRLAGLGAAVGTAYHVLHMADELGALASRVFQVVAASAMNVTASKALAAQSGVPFVLSVTASYGTLSGASVGADASGVKAFITVVHKARDLVRRVSDVLGEEVEVYSLSEPARTQVLPVDRQYMFVALAPGSTPAVTARYTLSDAGIAVTLTSTATVPVNVQLVVSYKFPGVRDVAQTVSVVVQPARCSPGYRLFLENYYPDYSQATHYRELVCDAPVTIPNGTEALLGLELNGQRVKVNPYTLDAFNHAFGGASFYGAADHHVGAYTITARDVTNNVGVNISIDLTLSNAAYRAVVGKTFSARHRAYGLSWQYRFSANGVGTLIYSDGSTGPLFWEWLSSNNRPDPCGTGHISTIGFVSLPGGGVEYPSVPGYVGGLLLDTAGKPVNCPNSAYTVE